MLLKYFLNGNETWPFEAIEYNEKTFLIPDGKIIRAVDLKKSVPVNLALHPELRQYCTPRPGRSSSSDTIEVRLIWCKVWKIGVLKIRRDFDVDLVKYVNIKILWSVVVGIYDV